MRLCVTGLTDVTVPAYLALMSMSGLIFQIHLTFIPRLLPLSLSHLSSLGSLANLKKMKF